MRFTGPQTNNYGIPPLRPELQAAYDEMGRQTGFFTWAVCRTWDGLAWEVNVAHGNIFTALDSTYTDHEAAVHAGRAWAQEQAERLPSDLERDFRALWEAQPLT